jgi:hypothetical protein
MSEISKVDLIQVESKAVVTDVRENREEGRRGKTCQWVQCYYMIGGTNSVVLWCSRVNIINDTLYSSI